ncbi:MAG: ABC transporter permease [Planctomycetota bacterium]|nr:ABC transporter permease [Planctomycetota bacterium]
MSQITSKGKGTFSASHAALAVYTGAVYLFLYAPIVILIVFSFNRAKQTAVWEGFTLEWYAKLLGNAEVGHAVVNSLIVGGLTTLLATLIGTPAGLALARHRFPGETVTRALLYLPLVIPEIVFGAALVTLLGLAGFRLGLWSVVIAHVVFSVPYVAIVVRSRLAGMDRSLEEAAADLGASPAEAFRRVTLPLLMPGVVAAGLLVFTLSLDDYLITSFVAGVGATTLPLKIYSMLKTGVTPEINAVSSLLLVVTMALVLVAQVLLRDPTPKDNVR